MRFLKGEKSERIQLRPPGLFDGPDDWESMQESHALPKGWETMTYTDFLDERRKLMAAIIRKGFETLR